MLRGGRRRFPKVSITGLPERAAPFDVGRPFDIGGGRDSDASLCSSRPSSAGGRPSSAASALLTDRSSQSAALRSVNAYLSSLSAPTSLRPPLPSGREITDAFRFVLGRLDWPLADLDDDLPALLRHLGCPVKLNRSALKAPGTPHAWPPLLSVLYWLVQLARVSDHLAPPVDQTATNDFLLYVARSYSLFIGGDDDAVAELDDEYLRKAQHQAANATAAVEALEKQANDLEAKLRTLTSGPSRREALERERAMLVEDVKKFQAVVDTWGGKVAAMESALGDWEKELEAKEKEIRRICEENEELQKRIDAQTVNVRDAERMKRELQAVERDIAEAESGRNVLEEKAWELEAAVGRMLNELEVLSEQCNQAIRKLKLGNDFQYVLNAKGSSPAEVLGTNYKTILKPALSVLAEDTKKASVSKLEESINLQEQSRENVKMLEEKRDRLAALQFKIDDNPTGSVCHISDSRKLTHELDASSGFGGLQSFARRGHIWKDMKSLGRPRKAESRLRLLKNEMEDYTSKCAAEAEKMKEEFMAKEHQLCIVEKEAGEFLKNSERKLEDAVRESDEEVQMCARELLTLIDSVSEYKEYMESTISGMKTDLSEVADAVSSLSTKLVISRY